jgi:two-component system, OmpR family, response regulator VicR
MDDASATGRRILIAEDDHSIVELLTTLLHTEGYETDEVATLHAAQERIEENVYDLVVADFFTRDNQPPQLLDAQQLQQRFHPTPVGIITGWRVDQNLAKRAGFAFLLEKPFDLDELLQRIAACLDPPFTPEQAQLAHVIRRSLQALSAGDWETLCALCTPTFSYYLLTRSVFIADRALIGMDAYLAYARLLHQRLPGFRIDQVVIFQHSKGLIARYRANWQAPDGKWLRFSGSVLCRFQGERISRIGAVQPRARMQALVGQAQKPSGT